MIGLIAFLIGVIAGLRTMTAPAVVALAAWLGWLPLAETWASFMATPWAIAALTLLALAELVADQLPSTPSRKVPVQFGARLASGAFAGAVLGAAAGASVVGLVAGVIGAFAGTHGGAAGRARLARHFGRDRPAALTEDAVAILGGLLIVGAP